MQISKVLKMLNETNNKKIFVSFFCTSWGMKPQFVANVGNFHSLEEARIGCISYFKQYINTILENIRREQDSEYYEEVLELYKELIEDSEQWDFSYFINSGLEMWDMGESEYAFIAKRDSFATAEDISVDANEDFSKSQKKHLH